MDEGEYLIAKCIQAVRDGEAVLTAIIENEATWIKLMPTGSPEDFDKYWEGLDDDVCD
jgi:hypothetical protein